MSIEIGKDSRESFYEFLKALRRDRERLVVQANLGKKELRDEWEVVEKKWIVLERQLAEFSNEAEEAAHKAAHEIAEMYHRIRDRAK